MWNQLEYNHRWHTLIVCLIALLAFFLNNSITFLTHGKVLEVTTIVKISSSGALLINLYAIFNPRSVFVPVITTTLPLILQDIIAVDLLLNWHHKMNCILCVQYEYLLWLLTWLFESDDISYMTVLCWFIILVIFDKKFKKNMDFFQLNKYTINLLFQTTFLVIWNIVTIYIHVRKSCGFWNCN